jgi:anti-sigma-K factor RskA
LRVNELPELPEGQCYQMWADVDGEMLSLGVLPADTTGLIAWNFLADAESLNVTIEPEGGSDHPDVSKLVANVGI